MRQLSLPISMQVAETFWGTASTLRPNWFAPLLPIDMMDTSVAQIQEYITNSNHLIDGKYLCLEELLPT